jgi:hypothetical protein
MTYYGRNSSKGKQERYGMGSDKSNNQKHGKFAPSRNRHKKMIKSAERWDAKRFIREELKEIGTNNV